MTRIVSLIPSATEMVCSLGLESSLVGISHECDYPPSIQKLPRVTRSKIPLHCDSLQIDALVQEYSSKRESLYELDEELLTALAPDCIITQTLCNVCAVSEAAISHIREYALPSCRWISLAPSGLEDVLAGFMEIAKALDRLPEATQVLTSLRQRLLRVHQKTLHADRKRVVFLEWLAPLYCAGHWTPDLIWQAGGLECIGRANQPSRVVEWKEIQSAQPDVLCVSCCGMNDSLVRREWQSHLFNYPWTDLECVVRERIHFFDGNAYFNRPGLRLVDSVELLASVLHPEIEWLQCQP